MNDFEETVLKPYHATAATATAATMAYMVCNRSRADRLEIAIATMHNRVCGQLESFDADTPDWLVDGMLIAREHLLYAATVLAFEACGYEVAR